ncbi:MAG TPA: TetR/AcrR family transcriptional regulator, partial [Pyrinomonadaceae bacterium]|nr:TetR/AcrR family transcriptional regulator [Pyrinomonadaceae bacterium]
YTPQHKQETRERIVRAASRHFRRRGGKGVAIADLMSNLDLTHGGFYRHFDNKEQLRVEAVAKGFEDVRANFLAAVKEAPPADQLKAFIEEYLSLDHCANPADGCPIAALASEVARYPRTLRVKMGRAMQEHIETLAKFMPGATEEERERNCFVLVSGMSGALTVARTTADPELRKTILEAAKEFYIKTFCE